MAKITGQIGPLTRLLDIFTANEIDLFKTLDDITNFNNNSTAIINDTLKEIKHNLTLEINKLKSEALSCERDYNDKITQRETSCIKEIIAIIPLIHAYSQPQTNIFKTLFSKYKIYILKKRKSLLENNLENEKTKPFIPLQRNIDDLKKRINYLENNYNAVLAERRISMEEKYDTAKSILKNNYSLLLGAIGEQKAVNELRKLPDSYYIINDFQLLFFRPIFHKASDSYIESIQADHIVIGPSGIFLIETKNWSQESIRTKEYYSPVEQIKRTNFALYIYLNDSKNHSRFALRHDWGRRKITVRNILLMINNKPDQEFQYVKTLTLKELNGYIQYFNTAFSDSEIQALYNELSYDI